MYVLRCTEKLRREASRHLDAAADTVSTTTRLGDWFATRVNVGPQRYVLATSTVSLLSVVVAAKDLKRLPERLAEAADNLLQLIGVPDAARSFEIEQMQELRIGPTNNRSVLATMTALAQGAQLELYDVPHRPGRSLGHVNSWLAQVPCGALAWASPADVARRLLATAQPPAQESLRAHLRSAAQ